MKRFFSVLLVIVLFLITSVSANDKKFSKREKEKIELIKQVKKYGESLGLNSTNNFLKYEDKVSRYNIFFYNEKTKVPFSYIDPAITVVHSDHDNLEGSIKQFEVDITKYDVFFYTTIGVSGGTYITKKLLSCSDSAIAQTVLHEDLHDNMDLPRHFEEAAAHLFGVAAASKYFNNGEKEFRSTMSFTLLDALVLDELHSDITTLLDEYKSGKISFSDYLKKRDQKIATSWYDSMAEITQHHTYKHYYVLLYRLFKAMNYDLSAFIKFVKEFPYKQPKWDKGHEWYFEETLRVEKEAENYVEASIASLTSGLEEKVNIDISKETRKLIKNPFVIKNIKWLPDEAPLER